MIRFSISDAILVLGVLVLGGLGFAWSYASDGIYTDELRAIAVRETSRPAIDRAVFGAWRVTCEAEVCRAETAVEEPSGAATMIVQVAVNGERRGVLISIAVPIGIDIAPGVLLRTSTAVEAAAAILECAPAGCVARFFPETFLMTALRQSDALTIRYRRASGGLGLDPVPDALVSLHVPMAGFVQAIAAL
ncbi:MAG: invasion associated locus B family protein [Alphaproteobacteria bacterium]|nr:invasion associated locus B family protein [Alphaproteobacteria bacterium]